MPLRSPLTIRRAFCKKLPRTFGSRTVEPMVVAVLIQSLNSGTHRSGYSDRIWIAFRTTFDSIARRKEGIEALDKLWVACEQMGHSINYSRGINRLAFEVLHDVQKSIVHVRLLLKSDFHLV